MSMITESKLDDTKFCNQLIITLTICDILNFLNQNTRNSEVIFVTWWPVLSNYLGMKHTVLLHCPIRLKSGQLIANQICEFNVTVMLGVQMYLRTMQSLGKEVWKKFNVRDGRVGEKQSGEGGFQKLRYYMYYIYSE